MSEPLSLDRVTAGRLVDLAVRRSSGIVTVTCGKLKRLFCVSEGALVHAASNVLEEQFSERLVRAGLLDAGQRIAAADASESEGKKLGAYLAEQEIVPAADLRQAMETHVRELLTATLDLRTGECTFKAGRPDLGHDVAVQLSPTELILEYAREHPASVSEVRSRIGSPSIRPLVVESRRALVPAPADGTALSYVLGRSDGSAPLAELIRKSPVAPSDTLRTLYALLLLGVVQPYVETKKAEGAPVVTEAVTVDEVVARIKRSQDADYYAILELNLTATRDEVRDAYYFLARRYHPDRFRSGALKNLLAGIETYFARVTEAYNNLWDPALRAEYDRKRADDMPPVKAEPEQDTAYLAKQNYARAKILLNKGRHTDAVTFLENAVELDNMQALYFHTLGELLVRNPRRRDDAEKYLQRAIHLEPTRYETYLALGELYIKMARLGDAAEMLREVLRWEPGHALATQLLGAIEKASAGSGVRRGMFKG